MKTMRLVLLGTLFTAAGVLVYLNFKEDRTVITNRDSAATEPTHPIWSTSTPFIATLNRKLATPTTNKLIEQFNAARDGRALVMNLWDRPREGGRFYASALVDSCASIASSTDILKEVQPRLDLISPENQSRVIAAFDRLHTRCSQFTEDEYQKYSRSGLLRKNENEDPLVTKVNQFINSNKQNNFLDRIDATKDILSTKDPLLFEDVGIRLYIYHNSDGNYFYYDGNNYPVNNNPAIAAAYYLLPCGLGLTCDASDPDLALRCIQSNQCYADRFDRVQNEFAAGNAARYGEIIQLYESMLTAATNNDFSRFIPPHN